MTVRCVFGSQELGHQIRIEPIREHNAMYSMNLSWFLGEDMTTTASPSGVL